MVERGDGARFSLETVARDWIGGDVRREYFDRDRPIEPRVARLVDFAHSPGADPHRELVRTDAAAFQNAGQGVVRGQTRRPLEKRVRVLMGGEQLLDLVAERFVSAADLVDVRLPHVRRQQ